MTTAEALLEEEQYDLMDAYFDAMEAGDYEKAKKIRKNIILEPEAAMMSLRSMGKKRLLATGLNLSAATTAFGEGWLDEKPRPRKLR